MRKRVYDPYYTSISRTLACQPGSAINLDVYSSVPPCLCVCVRYVCPHVSVYLVIIVVGLLEHIPHPIRRRHLGDTIVRHNLTQIHVSSTIHVCGISGDIVRKKTAAFHLVPCR